MKKIPRKIINSIGSASVLVLPATIISALQSKNDSSLNDSQPQKVKFNASSLSQPLPVLDKSDIDFKPSLGTVANLNHTEVNSYYYKPYPVISNSQTSTTASFTTQKRGSEFRDDQVEYEWKLIDKSTGAIVKQAFYYTKIDDHDSDAYTWKYFTWDISQSLDLSHDYEVRVQASSAWNADWAGHAGEQETKWQELYHGNNSTYLSDSNRWPLRTQRDPSAGSAANGGLLNEFVVLNSSEFKTMLFNGIPMPNPSGIDNYATLKKLSFDCGMQGSDESGYDWTRAKYMNPADQTWKATWDWQASTNQRVDLPDKDKLVLDDLILDSNTYSSLDATSVKTILRSNGNAINWNALDSWNITALTKNPDQSVTLTVEKRNIADAVASQSPQASFTGSSQPATITITTHIINLDGMFSFDKSTGTEYDYSSGGKTLWTTQPKLRLTWNKDFFTALDAFGQVSNLKQRVATLAFTSETIKNDVLSKVDSLEINQDNIDDVMATNGDYASIQVIAGNHFNWWKLFIASGQLTADSKAWVDKYLSKAELSVDATFATDDPAIPTKTEKIDLKDALQKDMYVQVPITDNSLHQNNQWEVSLSKINFANAALGVNTTSSIVMPDTTANLENSYLLKIAKPNPSTVVWKYLLQQKPKDISKDITFQFLNSKMELNDKFQIIKDANGNAITPSTNAADDNGGNGLPQVSAGASGKTSAYGWKAAYYPYNISTGKIDYSAKLWIYKEGGEWLVPDLQNQKLSDILTAAKQTLDPLKITYVFSDDLQLFINPYPLAINSAVDLGQQTPSYGIKRVTDKRNNSEVVLEDWQDGQMNHLTDANGNALIDGIFGRDPNGLSDPFSIFSTGTHQVNVDLFLQNRPQINTNFMFEIDDSVPTIDVSDSVGTVNSSWFNSIFQVFSSDQPITLKFEDENLDDVKAYFWTSTENKGFEIPISPTVEGGKVVYEAKFIPNYQGMMLFRLKDKVGNLSEQLAYINSNENAGVPVVFDGNSPSDPIARQQTKNPLTFNGLPLYAFKSSLPSSANKNMGFLDNDPTHTDIKIEKFDSSNLKFVPLAIDPIATVNPWKVITDNHPQFGQVVSNTNPTQNPNLSLGDALTPFLPHFTKADAIDPSFASSPVGKYLFNDFNSALPTNNLLKVTYTSLVTNLENSYYIYVTDQDLSQVNNPFLLAQTQSPIPTSDPSFAGGNKLVVEANATDEVKNNRAELLQLEKSAFLKLVELERIKKTINSWNSVHTDLPQQRALIDKYKQDQLDEVQGYKAEQDALLLDNKTKQGNFLGQSSKKYGTQLVELWLDGHPAEKDAYDKFLIDVAVNPDADEPVLPSSDEMKTWLSTHNQTYNDLIKEYNTIITSDDYVALQTNIDEIMINLDANVKAKQDVIQKYEGELKELQDKQAAAQKAYDDANSAWKAGIKFASAQDTKVIDIDSQASNDYFVESFLYGSDSHTDSGYFGYVSHPYSSLLHSSVGNSIKETGSVEWHNLHQDQSAPFGSNLENFFTKDANGNYVTGQDHLALTSKEGGSIYDGANLMWNGAELEDYDHLISKQSLFIMQNPNVDADELWNLLEVLNQRRAEGKEAPLNPNLLKEIISKENQEKNQNGSNDPGQTDGHSRKSGSGTSNSTKGAIFGGVFGGLSAIGLGVGTWYWRKKGKVIK